MTSVRLFLRGGQQCDLHVEKVTEIDGRWIVDAQSRAHGGLIVELSFGRDVADVDGEEQADNAVVGSASSEDIGEDDGATGDVSNQGRLHLGICGPLFSPFNDLTHFNSLQYGSQQLRNNPQFYQHTGARGESSEAAA